MPPRSRLEEYARMCAEVLELRAENAALKREREEILQDLHHCEEAADRLSKLLHPPVQPPAKRLRRRS